MKGYTLGLYEKAMPGSLTWKEKLLAAKSAGYDFVEISIDETDEKLSRLEMTSQEWLELVRLMAETGIPIRTMCLSGHRKYPLGSSDPQVCGRGAALLREAGLTVQEDFLRAECDALNPIFFHYIQTKTPYVAMKSAMTADGKIATRTGASRYVTGEAARARVQQLRHQYRGILVGIGTALYDDPLLTCRLPDGRNPVRIVCDAALRLPIESQLVQTAGQAPLVVACCHGPADRRQRLEQLGVTVLDLPAPGGQVDLPALMRELGRREIDSVLLEGGGTLNEAMVQAGLVQKVYCFLAPRFFGGRDAKTPLEGPGAGTPDEGWQLALQSCQQLAGDLLLEYEVKEHVHRHH